MYLPHIFRVSTLHTPCIYLPSRLIDIQQMSELAIGQDNEDFPCWSCPTFLMKVAISSLGQLTVVPGCRNSISAESHTIGVGVVVDFSRMGPEGILGSTSVGEVVDFSRMGPGGILGSTSVGVVVDFSRMGPGVILSSNYVGVEVDFSRMGDRVHPNPRILQSGGGSGTLKDEDTRQWRE
jgi:hypothetical protein